MAWRPIRRVRRTMRRRPLYSHSATSASPSAVYSIAVQADSSMAANGADHGLLHLARPW